MFEKICKYCKDWFFDDANYWLITKVNKLFNKLDVDVNK